MTTGTTEPQSPPPGAGLRRNLPAMSAALTNSVIFVVVLSVPLAAADQLGLSPQEVTAWIMALYGISAILSVVLVLRYRQPLVVTGNFFILLFVVSLGNELTWPELVGASIVAGAVVLAVGVFGLSNWLAAWLPAPIVYGVLAGAVLPFFVGLFTAFGDSRVVVGTAFAAYLLGRRFLEPRVPAIFLALLAGLAVAGLTGGFGSLPAGASWDGPVVTAPQFSLAAILTAAPVMVVLITLQANIPSLVFLRGQGYRPPEKGITVLSGAGTMLSSLLGPTGLSLSLPATAIAAGPDAGEPALRHRSVYPAMGTAIAVAVLAGLASEIEAVVPRQLLLAVVGLAVIGIVARAVEQVVTGPLQLGPMLAFGLALSDVSILGLGPFFWALAVGTTVSLLVEREGWKKLRQPADHS